MVQRLLPVRAPVPLWRREGQRALEALQRSRSPTPLMDLAGLACARLALAIAPHARCIWVLAGPGNNGGDGLEAALHLHRWGLRVQVQLLASPEALPADARRAWQRASDAGVPLQIGLHPAPALGAQDLCIDALLGLGASRAPEGRLREAIHAIRRQNAPVLAIDLPSGLDTDSGQPLGTSEDCVRAHHTLCLLAAKPGLFMGQGRDLCGQLWLDTLGLPASSEGLPTPDAWLNAPPAPVQRAHASHKGSHGDVAVVGGESLSQDTGMSGAALLAAQAALHGGAGRVMLSLLGPAPAGAHTIAPDLMRRALPELPLGELTVVAGCGGGRAIAQPLGTLLQRSARLVLDADGLNRLAEDPWLQDLLRERARRGQPTVLTPHPLEAARLLGCNTAQVQADRLRAAQDLATGYGAVVVLKGSGTVLAAPGQIPRISPSGNGLLATGGTGDVLAGLAGARLARSGDAWAAACDAVWTHGQAADDWPTGQALTASALAERLR